MPPIAISDTVYVREVDIIAFELGDIHWGRGGNTHEKLAVCIAPQFIK